MSEIVRHEIGTAVISQREKDGYIDATAMCQASGKKLNDYGRLGSTRAFIEELSENTGIPALSLVEPVKGRGNRTWVHPYVAIHLAQWCSPRFAVLVSKWVFEWMKGGMVSRAEYEKALASHPKALPRRKRSRSLKERFRASLRWRLTKPGSLAGAALLGASDKLGVSRQLAIEWARDLIAARPDVTLREKLREATCFYCLRSLDGLTTEEIAEAFGVSLSQVHHTIELRKLSPRIRDAAMAGSLDGLPVGAAMLLVRADQRRQDVIIDNLKLPVSVRKMDALLRALGVYASA